MSKDNCALCSACKGIGKSYCDKCNAIYNVLHDNSNNCNCTSIHIDFNIFRIVNFTKIYR